MHMATGPIPLIQPSATAPFVATLVTASSLPLSIGGLSLLRSLWAEGNGPTVDEIARRLGDPGLELEPLLKHFYIALGAQPQLATYPYLAAARADFLRRLGRRAEAASAYQEALLLTSNEVERRYLGGRLEEVS